MVEVGVVEDVVEVSVVVRVDVLLVVIKGVVGTAETHIVVYAVRTQSFRRAEGSIRP